MNHVRFTVIFAVLVLSCAIALADQSDPCAKVDVAAISSHIPNLPLSAIESKKAVAGGLCEVILRVEEDSLPVYVSPDFVLIGDMFTKGHHQTKAAMDERNEAAFRENRQLLSQLTAISYKPANTRTSLYFITDPDCGYCERAKKSLKDFADQYGVEIKVVFFPLPMHENARPKAEKAICAGISYADYIEGNYPGETCKDGVDKVAKSMEVLTKLKVNGTPTFITEKGRLIVGFDPAQLKEAL